MTFSKACDIEQRHSISLQDVQSYCMQAVKDRLLFQHFMHAALSEDFNFLQIGVSFSKILQT